MITGQSRCCSAELHLYQKKCRLVILHYIRSESELLFRRNIIFRLEFTYKLCNDEAKLVSIDKEINNNKNFTTEIHIKQ